MQQQQLAGYTTKKGSEKKVKVKVKVATMLLIMWSLFGVVGLLLYGRLHRIKKFMKPKSKELENVTTTSTLS